MNNTKSFAERELEILCKMYPDPDNGPIVKEFIPEILALVEKFNESGQSGGSAPYVAGAISDCLKKLMLHKPICPVTGEEDEWMNCNGMGAIDIDSSQVWQNTRCGSVFKDSNISNGKPYYLDAIVWKGQDDYDTFSGTLFSISSRQFIKSFPFTPKTFYIDVIRYPYDETNPNHVAMKQNVISCGPGDMIYILKDVKQLDAVWEYYDSFTCMGKVE